MRPFDNRIIVDSRIRPYLFHWNGQIDPVGLNGWLSNNGLLNRIPDDLINFWVMTGGGDFLESETILGPFGVASMGDDLIVINKQLRSRGLSSDYLVFHIGICMSAIDLRTKEYTELSEPDFKMKSKFPSFDEWYNKTIRLTLGPRYGLQ